MNWAFEGVVYALRTQRNMQIHVAAAAVALVMALTLNVSRLELLAIIVAICLVVIAEMFNTALEAAVDAVITEYHPLVKVAKDVAAGAVLVAAANAAVVAYLVFYDHLTGPRRSLVDGIRDTPVLLVVAALILTVLASVAIKALTFRDSGRGTALRGGWPSGHAAAGFAAWTAITIVVQPLTHATLVSLLAFLMAMMVAQSRVEGGIHSAMETVAGALVGTCMTVVVFHLWG